MASLNRSARQPQITTHEGGKAYHQSKAQELERSVMSCMLWEDTFYEDGVSIADRIATLIPQVDPVAVADIAIRAKQDMRLRHVPLLLAVELAKTKEGRETLKYVIPAVVTRVDDITELLSIYWRNGKKPVAKQIKKHLGESFRKFNEYQLAKYNGGKKAVKLRDALRITRPKPDTIEQAALWQRLISGELATPDTWEVELSASKDKKASWERLLKEKKLGGLAMLRNIRNMNDAGVSRDDIRAGIMDLNVNKLLPVNFLTSANHNPTFAGEIEEKFLESFAQVEKDHVSTVLLVDVSGSMRDRLSGRGEVTRQDVAETLAIIARERFSDLQVVAFGNNSVTIPSRRGFGLRDAIRNASRACGGGTELGKAVRSAPSAKRVIVLTDEQTSDRLSGNLAPGVKGYMVNVAAYQNSVVHGDWVRINGWSDKVLDYILTSEAK